MSSSGANSGLVVRVAVTTLTLVTFLGFCYRYWRGKKDKDQRQKAIEDELKGKNYAGKKKGPTVDPPSTTVSGPGMTSCYLYFFQQRLCLWLSTLVLYVYVGLDFEGTSKVWIATY